MNSEKYCRWWILLIERMNDKHQGVIFAFHSFLADPSSMCCEEEDEWLEELLGFSIDSRKRGDCQRTLSVFAIPSILANGN